MLVVVISVRISMVVLVVEVEPEVDIAVAQPISQTPQSVNRPLEVIGVVFQKHGGRRLVEVQSSCSVIQSRIQVCFLSFFYWLFGTVYAVTLDAASIS